MKASNPKIPLIVMLVDGDLAQAVQREVNATSDKVIMVEEIRYRNKYKLRFVHGSAA